MTTQLRQIHPADNVAVIIGPVDASGEADGIPSGHKKAIRPIAVGEAVVKYGHRIGRATCPIAAGEHVHSHNLSTSLGEEMCLEWVPPAATGRQAGAVALSPDEFLGYRRPDGRVAIRNEIWILNTVACVNVASQRIAAQATAEWVRPGGPIDGIFAFTHPFGCSQLGDDLKHTRTVLAALTRHPHAAGVLVLGLGCENNTLREFMEAVGGPDSDRVRFFNAQDVGDEIERGMEEVRKLVEVASGFRREPIPAGELIIGMKCGGSDGFSGITANPLVGRVGDELAARGGTVLLSEVPEMFGAEVPLLARCRDASVFAEAATMIDGFKEYFRSHGEPIHENPSPGNKDGGITTLEEKSLGCVQKGGNSEIREVVRYGGAASPRLGGVALVEAPGNDGVSCTALAAAGAHMILFTTGRGTPLGVPVPTMKIATNSSLAGRKPGWIDFDAGVLIGENAAGMEATVASLWQKVLAVAGGQATRNEINGFREITLWKQGVTL